MRAIDAVLGQPWAIDPQWLPFIAAVAERQFDNPAVAAMQANPPRAAERGVSVRNGVAVIGLVGPIFPRANIMTENSGATSIERSREQFRAALADTEVKAILLNIDSPGGAVSGVAEFAAEVFAARKRKPVVAYAAGAMASAAYWIGSAASRVVVDPTALIGSIGVATAASKQVSADQAGEMTYDIVSTNAPDKRPDPSQPQGHATIVATLDSIEGEFIAAVAKHRGVDAETVRAEFGRGGVKVGREAVDAGMADAVGTFDSVLTALAATGPVKSPGNRAVAAAHSEKPKMNEDNAVTTVAQLEAAHPDLVTQIRAAARSEGVSAGAEAERARIAGIQAHAMPGMGELVAEMVADGKTTPDQAAGRILAAHKAGLGKQAQAIVDVETITKVVTSAPAATRSDARKVAAPAMTKEGWKAEWTASAELQAEFPTADHYVNYQTGVAEGRIKVLKSKSA